MSPLKQGRNTSNCSWTTSQLSQKVSWTISTLLCQSSLQNQQQKGCSCVPPAQLVDRTPSKLQTVFNLYAQVHLVRIPGRNSHNWTHFDWAKKYTVNLEQMLRGWNGLSARELYLMQVWVQFPFPPLKLFRPKGGQHCPAWPTAGDLSPAPHKGQEDNWSFMFQ